MSDVSIHGGDAFSMYLPLLHIPTKQSSAYYGLAEVLKLPGLISALLYCMFNVIVVFVKFVYS